MRRELRCHNAVWFRNLAAPSRVFYEQCDTPTREVNVRIQQHAMKRTQVNTPKYWLERAREARTVAQRTRDRKVQAAMTGLSDGYERVAKRVEQLRA